jgi:hypothetical protein
MKKLTFNQIEHCCLRVQEATTEVCDGLRGVFKTTAKKGGIVWIR